jgi:hypothetical protein
VDDDGNPQPDGVLPSERGYEPVEAGLVDSQEMLDRVRELRVRPWRRRAGGATEPEHLGPAAEEFYDVFEVGSDPDHIAAGDTDAVVIAAVQALADRLEERDDRIERQSQRLDRQREVIDEQRADIERLREQLETLRAELSRQRRDADEDA